VIDLITLDHLPTFEDVLAISTEQNGRELINTGGDSFIFLSESSLLDLTSDPFVF
jgi:hypothetical protein